MFFICLTTTPHTFCWYNNQFCTFRVKFKLTDSCESHLTLSSYVGVVCIFCVYMQASVRSIILGCFCIFMVCFHSDSSLFFLMYVQLFLACVWLRRKNKGCNHREGEVLHFIRTARDKDQTVLTGSQKHNLTCNYMLISGGRKRIKAYNSFLL